jgi:CheY-like chemotaxis protein
VTAEPHRCSILFVDDDADVQEVVRVALTAEGYSVASAARARDAIDYLRSHADTCAILLDLLLPDLEGAEFRRIQLRDRSLAWIPVVVTSAAVDAQRIARELGAAAFVRKPLDLDELRRTISRVTGRNRFHGLTPVELADDGGRPLSSG